MEKHTSQTFLTSRNTMFLSTMLLGFPNTLSNCAKLKLPMIPLTLITTLRR
ncbi:hypothetical protein CR513_52149 [Mucuna pruriens]|uniref:Uncharacterized protein n=1 Tax=Mucuna pruriens TaxID=157652 RepID=A0A371ERZ5_MUCPR|nr:hypothetical protein CR513_52149 [Mucuna pruriens]